MARQRQGLAGATASAHARCAKALRAQADALRQTAVAFRAVAEASRREAEDGTPGYAEERAFEAKLALQRAAISEAEALTCEHEAGAADTRAARAKARRASR